MMCYHSLWKEVLGALCTAVKFCLRKRVFHTFQCCCIIFLYIIHFLVQAILILRRGYIPEKRWGIEIVQIEHKTLI
jgi:uncharacterized membrane protein